MTNFQSNTFITGETKQEHRCIVKLTTTYYATKKGLFSIKSLQYAKRLSYGFNILQEDISNTNAKEVSQSILNLNECKDGLYEVITTNHSYDYESGHCDNYDIKLIPYTKE